MAESLTILQNWMAEADVSMQMAELAGVDMVYCEVSTNSRLWDNGTSINLLQ